MEHVTDGCTCEGKKCKACQTVKCYGAFATDRRLKSGIKTFCKICAHTKNKAWREANQEYDKQRHKSYREQHQEENRIKNKQWRETNKEYDKQRHLKWRKENPEIYFAQQRKRHFRRHAEDLAYSRWYNVTFKDENLKRKRTRYHNNIEESRTKAREGYRKHTNKRRAQGRIYYWQNQAVCSLRFKKYYWQNKSKMIERVRRHQREHPEQHAIRQANRRARKTQAGGSFTVLEWKALKERYNNTCLACGKQEPQIKLHADHILPIVKGGSSNIDNIQPLCATCNISKGAKFIDFRPKNA